MALAARPAIELLDTTRHDRSAFSCGSEALDRYLRSQGGQDARRRVAAPYVMVEPPCSAIVGFYTLSNTSIRAAGGAGCVRQKAAALSRPSRDLLGRLAVDAKRRGAGIGSILLLDALRRCLRSKTASLAVVVEAKDDAAIAFYERHEFLRLFDQPNRLFKPMGAIEKLFVQ